MGNPILPVSRLMRKWIKHLAYFIYRFFNLFYYPILRFYFLRKVKKVPRSVQLFLMTRLDFGTFPLLLHYARCWQEKRGPACVVVLTAKAHLACRMAKLICPEVQLIHFDHLLVRWIPQIFGWTTVQCITYNPIYCRLAYRWPHALYIFDQRIDANMKESISNYNRYFDKDLREISNKQSPEFIEAYLSVRQIADYRISVYQDWINLHYMTDLKLRYPVESRGLIDELKITGKFAVFNINTKVYLNSFQDRKRVVFPERYNTLFDYLISLGYQVVLQGRSEQPLFKPRKGLIDYSRSSCCSIENDIRLYSCCEFAVLPKSGPELLATVCNVPILGLNTVEHCAMQPNARYRFFPKHLWNRRLDRFLSWEEFLSDSCFFDLGDRNHNPDIQYVDLGEKEMLQALEEFLGLLQKPSAEWIRYAPHQQSFKSRLTPLHLDLFKIKGVPCEVFFNHQLSSSL